MARPDDEDEIAKSKRPQLFPRVIDGYSLGQMQEYIGELEVEIAKVKTEISKRDSVKAKAEALFKS
jgi:uncharacterized small protein (DUF1192 family)